MSANIKDMNTRDEVRLLLLEQAQGGIQESLKQINNKIDALDKKIDARIDALDNRFDRKIDKLQWSIVGIYAGGFATLLGYIAKTLHWFS